MYSVDQSKEGSIVLSVNNYNFIIKLILSEKKTPSWENSFESIIYRKSRSCKTKRRKCSNRRSNKRRIYSHRRI